MLRNLVRESAASPGTGTTVTLSGAQTGFLSFASAFATSQQVFYLMTDGAQHEMQAGQLTVGSPNTLARGTPLWTSTGGGTRLNFTGAVTVYNTVPASKALYLDSAGTVSAALPLPAQTSATPADYAARMDSLGWRMLSVTSFATSTALASLALPSGYQRFRVLFEDVVPASGAGLYMRWSMDNLSTFLSGASDYRYAANITRSSAANPTVLASGGLDHIRISLDTTAAMYGEVEFSATGAKPVRFRTGQYDATPLITLFEGAGICGSNTATPTHIGFGAIGVNMTQGRFRLMGAVL